ncbi:MAG: hypothetical protein GQF41_4503 [Candidatus Rifleibacterium amylolyticum]|nr:MAG: hypothetical protein GQF41_4503 [Candidatus Rifleibacterium amylolyticum]
MGIDKLLFRKMHAKAAAAILALLLLMMIACSEVSVAHASSETLLDHTRLYFETVAGDYGSIYNVIQDKDGFLWLAGINGAIKYNGYKAENVNSGETVSALFEDSQGLIWMVVGSGVAVYDKRSGSVDKFFPDSSDPGALSGYSRVAYQKTQLLTEDRDGYIWIATANGLNRYDKKTRLFTSYKSRAGDAATFLDNDIWSVLTAGDGFLWIGTVTGLHRFDPRKGQVVERYAAGIDEPDAIHGKYIQAISEDNQGNIWIGTIEGGLSCLDPEKKTFSYYSSDSEEPRRIANNFIYRIAFFESVPDLIWITTVDGLSVLNKMDNTVTNYVYTAEKADKGSLGAKIVHTIIQDSCGVFWLVVNEHGYLQKIDPGGRQFNSILRSQNPEAGFVDITAPLRLGPDGNIWVNEVTSGIARVDPDTGRIIDHLLYSPRQPDGFPMHLEDFEFEPRSKEVIWAVAKGEIVEYNWKTHKVLNRYPSATQSKIWPVWTDKENSDLLYGNVWGDGILKFNKKTGQVTFFTSDADMPDETLSGHANFPLLPAYYQMEGNQIWISNPGIGFDLFDLNSGKVVRKHHFDRNNFSSREFDAHAGYIDSKGRFWIGQNQYDQARREFISFESLYGHSFPSTSVCAIAEDRHGMIWAAGFLDGTLTRINPETGETRVFTERDGISPGLGSAYAPVTLPDGQIWMAGTGGVTCFYPDRIVDNSYQPPVYITSLTQGSRPLIKGIAPERVKEITLNWNENYFEFEMAALNYRRPEENKYQYMLEGVDREWYFAGRKREGRYSGIPYGTHVLRVRGSNNDGVWSSHEAALTIVVLPPWWNTPWFRGSALMSLLLIVLLGYRQRVRGIEQRSLELESLVRERTNELQLAKENAEKSRQSAEIANRAKSIFLANMSHELRTPLNAVLGFSQLMKVSSDVTSSQKESLDIINRSGEHLLRLINNVLDISKIESGRVELEAARCDLHQVLQEMMSMLYVQAREKGLKLTLEALSELPRYVVVDGGKLRQVLINLVGNAIKYTRQGEVVVRARKVEQVNIEQVKIRFEVTDTGIGISNEDQKSIFAPFVQLGERQFSEAGTGLGLAICKQYVELMGGEIGVFSRQNVGSTFYFEIPVSSIAQQETPFHAVHGSVVRLADGQPKYRLLIAEDQPENRTLLRKLLDKLEFDIQEAANGKDAVDIFRQWSPHLIWMDMRMPIMDGLEATRIIRAMANGAEVKIIAVTAHALEAERREIMTAGCDDFIRKPYRDVEIFDALARHLGLRFSYDDSSPDIKSEALRPDALSELPCELCDELEQAIIRIDSVAINETINKIGSCNPLLAKKLAALASELQYGQILRFIQSSPDVANPEDEL